MGGRERVEYIKASKQQKNKLKKEGRMEELKVLVFRFYGGLDGSK